MNAVKRERNRRRRKKGKVVLPTFDNQAMLEYFGGKPTSDQLQQQMGLALDTNSAAEIALRLLPATAAVGTVLGIGNIALGGDTLANRGMDLLGMGAGAYGMMKNTAYGGESTTGRVLRGTGGALAGKLSSDIIQLLIGGGRTQSERELEDAIRALGGNV